MSVWVGPLAEAVSPCGLLRTTFARASVEAIEALRPALPRGTALPQGTALSLESALSLDLALAL